MQFYAPVGGHHSEDQLLEHVTSGLIAALCASQPSLFPRSRWTGADLATDCLGVLEACHRLLSTTFMRFAAAHEQGPRAMRLLALAGQLSKEDALISGEVPAVEDGQAEEAGAAPEEEPGEGAHLGHHAGSAASKDQQQTWAEANAASRNTAVQWLLTKPLGKLILQRCVMEPLRVLLRKQFECASDDWEEAQRAKLLTSRPVGEGPCNFREYRVTRAASGQDEVDFFKALGLLLSSTELWEVLPTRCYTAAFRSLAFRLISRAGCAIHQNLAHPHTQFPWKLFRLLKEPDLAPELCEVPDCMLDEWSLSMRRQHPTLSGEDFRKQLECVCLLAWKDISQIEARHASIRRLLLAASLQTRTQCLSDLSANWVFQQTRKRNEKRVRLIGQGSATTKQASIL